MKEYLRRYYFFITFLPASFHDKMSKRVKPNTPKGRGASPSLADWSTFSDELSKTSPSSGYKTTPDSSPSTGGDSVDGEEYQAEGEEEDAFDSEDDRKIITDRRSVRKDLLTLDDSKYLLVYHVFAI